MSVLLCHDLDRLYDTEQVHATVSEAEIKACKKKTQRRGHVLGGDTSWSAKTSLVGEEWFLHSSVWGFAS